jgi:putative DNA primase/helicase
MRRRTPGEQIERLRFDQPNLFAGVRRRLARFAMDARPALERADPAIPAHLHDRAADNWRVLFAIADAAGGDWPSRAHAACIALSASQTDAETIGATLLSDIQTAFVMKGGPVKLSSADLCQTLADDEASPWAAFGRSEKPITPAALARLLKRFKIAPKVLRNGSNVWRGYECDAFTDAWSRYLNPDIPPQSVTPLQALKHNDLKGDVTRNEGADVTPCNPPEVLTGQAKLRCNESTGGISAKGTNPPVF